MPTYEYECTKCGEPFEYFQSIKEAPKAECEKCGGQLVKLLSAGTGLIFKGSGFYITDYKPKGSEAGNGSGENKAEGGGGKDAKPATDSKSADGKASESKTTESKTTESKSAPIAKATTAGESK